MPYHSCGKFIFRCSTTNDFFLQSPILILLFGVLLTCVATKVTIRVHIFSHKQTSIHTTHTNLLRLFLVRLLLEIGEQKKHARDVKHVNPCHVSGIRTIFD